MSPMSLGLGLGLVHGGSVAFSPASLFAGGVLGYFHNWARESYTDTGLTTKAGSGDAVAGFADLSGNALHVTQGTAGKRAPLGTNAGFLAIETDGFDDSFQSAARDFTSVTAATIFVAGQHFQNSVACPLVESSPVVNSNPNAFAISLNDTAGRFGVTTRNSANTNWDHVPNTSISVAVPRVVLNTYVLDVTKPTIAERITVRSLGQPFSYTPVLSSGQMTNFGNYQHNYFARNNSIGFCAFRAVVFGFVGRICSAAEIAATEQYMARECGVSL
jgi:hypothetical protein